MRKTKNPRVERRKRILWLPRTISLEIYRAAADLPDSDPRKEQFRKAEKEMVRMRAEKFMVMERPGLVCRVLDLPGAMALCDALGLSLKDLLAKEGITLDWPNQATKDLDATISALPEEAQLRLESIMQELSAPCFVHSETALPASPTLRLEWFQKHVETRLARNIRSTYASVREGLAETTEAADITDFAEMMKLSEKLGICPQFLGCMISDEVKVLSTSAISEYTVVLWSFLSESNKQTFLNVVDIVKEEVGVK